MRRSRAPDLTGEESTNDQGSNQIKTSTVQVHTDMPSLSGGSNGRCSGMPVSAARKIAGFGASRDLLALDLSPRVLHLALAGHHLRARTLRSPSPSPSLSRRLSRLRSRRATLRRSGVVRFRARSVHPIPITRSVLFGPNPWNILAPPSNYLSKKGFWATQPSVAPLSLVGRACRQAARGHQLWKA